MPVSADDGDDAVYLVRLALGMLAAVLLLWPAAGGGENPITTWFRRGRWLGLERGVLRVAVDASYPPFATVDPSGQLVGMEVDLARELARRLDVPLALENTDAGNGLDALVADKYDLIIAGLPVYPELTQDVAFSASYYDDGLAVLVLQGRARTLDVRDLNGQSIGVEVGSPAEQALRRLESRNIVARIRSFWDLSDLVQAVQNGDVWGAVLDHTTARQIQARDDRFQVLYPLLESRPMVMAVRRANRGLLFAVDLALRDMDRTGWLASAHQRWISDDIRAD